VVVNSDANDHVLRSFCCALYIWSDVLRDHLMTIHSSPALPGPVIEDIKKYEPSDNEFTFMHVDRATGDIQVSKGGKRKRGGESSDSGVTEPCSSRPKR
jgi:hypothetical protein